MGISYLIPEIPLKHRTPHTTSWNIRVVVVYLADLDSQLSVAFACSFQALERTHLVKITIREFLDDILITNSMHIIVIWTGTYNFIIHQASAFKLKFYRLWCTKCNLLLSRGPLSRTRFISMAKHESNRGIPSYHWCWWRAMVTEWRLKGVTKSCFLPDPIRWIRVLPIAILYGLGAIM